MSSNQIFFKGIIEYLHLFVGINKQVALDIASQLDLDSPENIYKADLSYLAQEEVNELKEKLVKYPILPCAFLLGIGFPPNITEIILKFYDKSASLINIIKTNPYSLLEIEELSFKRVDKVALQLNIPEDSPLRQKALVLYQLTNYGVRNGHLFYDLEKFINSKFECDINTPNIKKYLKELILEKKIILENKKLYSSLNYKAECGSSEIIAKLIRQKNTSFFNNVDAERFIDGYEELQTKAIYHGKWKKLDWKDQKFKLSNNQKSAVKKFLTEKFFIITGLPGTGKTSLVKAFVDISKSRGLDITLITPTGISAKRLSDICDYPATTIHKELEFDGINWKKNENDPLTSDVIIVDEFSMVDQLLIYKLLLALPQNKDFVLVFVGDDAQLPSVGPGNVLKELILSNKIPHVRLTEIFRQEETSDIILNAHIINNGKTSLVNRKNDFVFINIEDETKILETIIKFVQKLKNKNFQILSPTYNGILGVTNLNHVLQDILNPDASIKKVFRTDNTVYKINDRVMIIKNDYQNEVYNGEQGIISDINNKTKKIDILINSKIITYSFRDSYSMFTLDYARTIHKAQSQEYENVIMPFVKNFSVQLQRNLLYTAVTRAKKKVYILGHKDALDIAIKNNKTSKRNTILSSRIASFLNIGV